MITDEEFAAIAQEAWDELPEEFASRIENLEIFIEDYPSEDVQESMDVGPEELLGLYTGVPQKHRSPLVVETVPDCIHLYRKNIQAICETREEVKAEIQKTLLHEIGHYFGIDDERLDELGF